jgi:hypothetical protein
MENNLVYPQPVQKTRPTGVWILTIYALIFVGLAPLMLSIFLLVSGNGSGGVLGVLLSIPISIGVITSAINAWKGSEQARRFLLAFVTLHYVLIAINNYILIRSGQVPDGEQSQLWGRILRGIIFPAIYIWYFNKRKIKDFFN